MDDKLAIMVLGNENSGKSHTWNTLFGRRVRTGKNLRTLEFPDGKRLDLFLVSGSPEERQEYVGDIVLKAPEILLISVQYCVAGWDTIQWLLDKDYDLYVQWLNPGFDDCCQAPDSLGMIPRILHSNGIFSIRNGQNIPVQRVNEIRDCLYGWAVHRNHLY